MNKIDEILDMRGTVWKQDRETAKSQLKAEILKEVLTMPECNCKHARSILKEQRTKLNELFNVKEK